MSTTSEIPLSPRSQILSVTIGDSVYGLRLTWCDTGEGFWLLDISDEAGKPIAFGIPLVSGVDLVGQLSYLGFDFKMFTGTDVDLTIPPTFSNLGITSHLWIEQ